MHEELGGGDQTPPEYHSAWPASPDGSDTPAGDAGQAQDEAVPPPGAEPFTHPGAEPFTPPGAEDDTGPLVPGLGAPAQPSAPGPGQPTAVYPGAPSPPPPPGAYPPPGGYGLGYPGAGYPGAPGYQGQGYQGQGYPGAGYPGGGYPGGNGYPGGGYPGGSYGPLPGGPGYGQRPPPKRTNRVITYVLVAALAAGVGAGTVLAMHHNSNNDASFSLPGAGSIPQPGSGSTGGSSNSSATTKAVTAKVSPGIVDVISTPSYQPGGTLEGTGMILTSSGLVLTNNHVVEGTTHEVAKIANTGQQYNVTVIGTDDTDDVALLKLQGASNLKTVPLGNSNSTQVGQAVVALGNAEGEDGAPAVVTGTITALGRSIQASDAGADTTENLHNMLETNAPIVEGDSGGALANTEGQVIGMDTAAQTSGAAAGTSGFAIPINRALSIARSIAAGHTSAQIQLGYPAFLGVTVARSKNGPSTSSSPQTQLQQLQQGATAGQGNLGGLGGSGGGCLSTSEASAPQSVPNVSSGVVVGGVLCGTPVTSIGMTAGAVITGIDSHTVTSPAELTNVLTGYKVGQSITITWVSSSGQHRTSKLTLIAGPAK